MPYKEIRRILSICNYYVLTEMPLVKAHVRCTNFLHCISAAGWSLFNIILRYLCFVASRINCFIKPSSHTKSRLPSLCPA